MKWELYLSRKEWEEIKSIVRERATKPGEDRPRCEWCGVQHGKLKRSKKGYLVPRWLETAHRHGSPLKSKNPNDYLALCRSCHMKYDRSPNADGLVSRYREGYAITTTDMLVSTLHGVGCDLWGIVGEGWYWRIGEMRGGPEETPARAAAMAVARLDRSLHGWMEMANQFSADMRREVAR